MAPSGYNKEAKDEEVIGDVFGQMPKVSRGVSFRKFFFPFSINEGLFGKLKQNRNIK